MKNDVTPPPAVAEMYRRLRTDELETLRTAFQYDYKDSTSDVTKHFCRGRLALIAEILAERTTSKTVRP